jgi:phosphate transport system substrate-binding protein
MSIRPGAFVNRVSFFALATLGTALACASSDNKGTDSSKSAAATSTTSTSGGADLIGAGATFPLPIYSKWISEYAARNNVKVNYQAIGSGGGI